MDPHEHSSKVQQQGGSSATLRVPRCCSRVLIARWRHPRRWFGTKRPQVQILSPDQCFRRSAAPTEIGEGLGSCQYSSKIRQVQQ